MNRLQEGLAAALTLTLIGGVLTAIVVYRQSISKFLSSSFPVAQIEIGVSTTPAGANTIVDGQDLGLSPLKASVRPGIHTIEVRKQGYYNQSQVIEVYFPKLKEPRLPAVFNLVLERDKRQTEEAPTPPIKATNDLPSKSDSPRSISIQAEQQLRKEIAGLKSMILVNPEDSVTVLALKDKVLVLTEETKNLKTDVQDLKGYSQWYIGISITFFLALVSAIGTLMFSRKQPS